MTDHFVEVPKKVLSPAAEAVLDAYYNAAKAVLDICGDFEIGSARNEGIAAALRALADQVVPTKPEPVTYPGDNKEEFIARYNVWLNMRLTRNKILAIATELEGQ